uniref:Uncharacterized protein n=1 Tax=Fagus sylvatica TaxID=28930 RepID=A0A2N9GH39_FAGSY
MRSKIKEINTRLQEIVTQKNDLQLRDYVEGRTKTRVRSRVPATSLVNKDHMYGRDEDKKAIVDLLLSGELSNTRLGLCFSVIPILGMGGLGKTTLAQLVYNDDNVSRYFDLKAWVCISEDFDIARVTKEILQDITYETCNDNDLNLLQRKLKEQLSGKKFLLILDDVWNENNDDWSELCKPFEFGAQGSKIIVTTRNDGVSSTMGVTRPYKLKELSNDACLTVFTQNAFGSTNFSAHPELEEIGQKILKRCNGSPLAAKVLGGLLCTTHNRDEWELVLNSKIWDIPEGKSNIFPALKLSYQYLPSHLKRLENVLDAEDARRANLNGKKNLDELAMKWESADDDLQDAKVAIDVLDMLCPWTTVKELSIDGYVGVKFPTWLGHSSFSNMVHLRIERCRKCTSLPAIGQLPSLKDLVIIGMTKVQSIGPEFYGESGLKPFQSLETLRFEDMQEWKDWIPCGDEYEEFSRLLASKKLDRGVHAWEYATIKECNSLTFISRGQLPSTLKRLKIRNCENLQLVVDKGEAPSSSLLMNEENLNTSLLERLEIWDCPSLKCLSSRGDLPATLKILKILRCSKLTSLSSSSQLPTALKHLSVNSCPKLESVADKLHNNVSLECLEIWNCEKLKSLPEGLHKLCHLNMITIHECSSLVSFPDGGLLPTSLRKLQMGYCEKLEALPNPIHNFTNLTSLELRGVNICKQVFEWGLHRLTSLTSLYIIDGFWDWQSFPSEEEDGKMMMMLPTSSHLLGNLGTSKYSIPILQGLSKPLCSSTFVDLELP